jgi:nucleoside-diphosphate-sugar epimerase
MKHTILVTGGMGYIGYHVVKQLLTHKNINKIVVLDSCLYAADTLDEFKNEKKLEIIKGDIRNIADLVKAIENIDIVIALAAIVGDPACALNEEETYSSNYHSTQLLVQLCNYYNIKRLIFASSCSVYGESLNELNEGSKINPLSLYAKTRIMSEEIIKKDSDNSLEWVILRFGTVFGWSARMRFDLVINFLTAKAYFEKNITIIGGDQWRPFIHVHDIARAVVLASLAKKNLVAKETFNVGDNRLNKQIKDLVKEIKTLIPKMKVHNTRLPSNDKRDYHVSFNKIQTILNFKAEHTIASGVKEIISHLQKKDIAYKEDKYYNVQYLYKYFKK